MGLAWQQGPLASKSVGHFLTPEPLPRLLFAEPLRRRMRVRFGGAWIADSQDVILLHEPGRYPVAYFPRRDVTPEVLVPDSHASEHPELGPVTWFGVTNPEREVERAAWQYEFLPEHARILAGCVAFAWRAMDAFYEEDERIVGHAADFYHRIDIRSTSRHLVVEANGRVVAESMRPLALYESGFAPRWYVSREDIDETALQSVDQQTFCPYKGLASYYHVAGRPKAAWSYVNAWPEVERIRDLVSFEPDKVDVYIDGTRLHLEPGQTVIPHGVDRGLDADEVLRASAVQIH